MIRTHKRKLFSVKYVGQLSVTSLALPPFLVFYFISLSSMLHRVKKNTTKPVAQSPDHFFHSCWKVSSAIYMKPQARQSRNPLGQNKVLSIILKFYIENIRYGRHTVKSRVCLCFVDTDTVSADSMQLRADASEINPYDLTTIV